MPELPEIYAASRLINDVGKTRFFRGPIVVSDKSKPEPLKWKKKLFRISASPRGKEMQMVLTAADDNETGSDSSPKQSQDACDAEKLLVTFNFGMSGKFSFDRFDQIPKHAHIQFFTTETPANVLSFVDYRRFGSWKARDFDYSRSPDPVQDYANFRQNVLNNLDKSVFNKAICEVIMEQQFFNGIGNYLRSEILYRAKIAPFVAARGVLENLAMRNEVSTDNPDLLDYCHIVPKEVFDVSKPPEGYTPNRTSDIYMNFKKWLRCYMVPTMNNLTDRQKRTIWFSGPPGPMVPVNSVSRHMGKKKRKLADDSEEEDEDDDSEKHSEDDESVAAAKKKTGKGRLSSKPENVSDEDEDESKSDKAKKIVKKRGRKTVPEETVETIEPSTTKKGRKGKISTKNDEDELSKYFQQGESSRTLRSRMKKEEYKDDETSSNDSAKATKFSTGKAAKKIKIQPTAEVITEVAEEAIMKSSSSKNTKKLKQMPDINKEDDSVKTTRQTRTRSAKSKK